MSNSNLIPRTCVGPSGRGLFRAERPRKFVEKKKSAWIPCNPLNYHKTTKGKFGKICRKQANLWKNLAPPCKKLGGLWSEYDGRRRMRSHAARRRQSRAQSKIGSHSRVGA
jgi:hypothetical protein